MNEKPTTMRLIVLSPGHPEREFEVITHHGDHETTESADAALATLTARWYEAQLSSPDDHADDGWRPVWRRLRRTPWRAVKHWPERPSYGRAEAFAPDVEGITAWLREMGVRLRWPSVLARPWPGHEMGQLHAATALHPDRGFRSGACRRGSALEYVVRMILTEGAESGALRFRLLNDHDALRDERNRDTRHIEAQDAEIRALRNEVRRLKGEPEVSEEEERAQARAHIQEILARRKTP